MGAQNLANLINPLEQAGYLEVSGSHLYTVLHGVANPVARILLVGPFATERSASYIPWVRWARFLADRQIEVLRYDYRGMGESTGVFEDMSFDQWTEDVEFLAGWLKNRSPSVPLILHGLEMGALLAGKVFSAGVANALLLWAPPASANEVLRATLLRQIAVENMFKHGQERKSAADYIRRLATEPLQVDGFPWSSKLWLESFQLEMASSEDTEDSAASTYGRPLRAVKLDKTAAPLVKGSAYEAMNPDLHELFNDNFAWIAKALAALRAKNFPQDAA